MGIWQFFVGMATIATIFSTVKELWSEKTKSKVILPIISILLAGYTGYLTYQNQELTSMQKEAYRISSEWPKNLRYRIDSAGEYRGIVIRGMVFFEKYKQELPESYKIIRDLLENAGVNKKVREDEKINAESEEFGRIHELAEMMIVLISDLGR